MPYFSSNAKQFIGELTTYLEQDPANDGHHLSEVVGLVDGFIKQEDLESAENAIQLLGTAVGTQRAWQKPYRSSGILDYILQQLNPASTATALAKQYLRVVGNSVADNDEIRELVLSKFDALVGFLGQPPLTVTALAVLLNLCNEYDAAQTQAATVRLDSIVAKLLALGKIPEEATDYATDLIGWTTEKLTTTQVEDDVSVETFEDLLKVTLQYDEDNYHDQVAVLAHYLQFPTFHQKLTKPGTINQLVELLFDYEGRLEPDEISDVFQSLSVHTDPEEESDREAEVVLMVQLVNSLSAISASDSFVSNFSVQSPMLRRLSTQLRRSPALPSAVCACVMLGNLATSDATCISMVKDEELHVPLLELLDSPEPPALTYAAAGFVRHLAYPELNRAVLAEVGFIETCCRLLVIADPSTRGEAAAILGKLVSNNVENITKVVTMALPEDIVPAKVGDVEVPSPTTILYHVASQALVPSGPVPSTSMKNAMIEIGRTIVAILRFLRQNQTSNDNLEAITSQVFQTPLLARPVARLVRQRFFAEARSEGLLGLGLLAQTEDGARLVIEEFNADEGLFDALKEFVLEGKGEGSQAEGLRRDHQNALVLLHGLTNNGGELVEISWKDKIGSLQGELASKIETP
ncbi:ARM repeat-containing protein [Aaosphaeria arxii CBS 175.79]|uniref:ARM repeat-containing protein n=1 Tax=Aaosphaeria arxii CBS 175.79 TaxID=1450172 RepID=A0A6A5XTP6_9PLEO|nr:ARM repeat-containing protein [Aaosphaeria arxii CBS 175.79]KAF2016187.1 ARM repeat-containing protein [Aaosphaeria arxii CBS 175.79]